MPTETSEIYNFNQVDRKDFQLWDFGWCDIICSQVSGFRGDSFIPANFFASLLPNCIKRVVICRVTLKCLPATIYERLPFMINIYLFFPVGEEFIAKRYHIKA